MANQELGWEDDSPIDLSSVPDAPPPFVGGIYRCKVGKGELTPTKEKKPQVTFTFKAVENLATNEEANKAIRYQRLMFVPETLWMVKQFCAALQVDPPASTGAAAVKEWVADLEGREFIARVTAGKPSTDPDTGEVRPGFPGVTRYLAPEQVEEAVETARNAASNAEIESPPARRGRKAS